MLQYLASSITNMAARALRAVCILSLTGLIATVWATDNTSAETAAIKPSAVSKTTPPGKPPVKTLVKSAKPLWSDLTPAQQHALSPLSADWDKIDTLRKQKWVEVANKFPAMKPEKQQLVQDRMRDWAKLTPAQRRAARESYARAKKLNPDQKSEKWQEYQNLPEEEKKKLAAEVENKKRLANLPRSGTNKNKTQTSVKPASKSLPEKPAAQQPAPPQTVPPASQATTQVLTK